MKTRDWKNSALCSASFASSLSLTVTSQARSNSGYRCSWAVREVESCSSSLENLSSRRTSLSDAGRHHLFLLKSSSGQILQRDWRSKRRAQCKPQTYVESISTPLTTSNRNPVPSTCPTHHFGPLRPSHRFTRSLPSLFNLLSTLTLTPTYRTLSNRKRSSLRETECKKERGEKRHRCHLFFRFAKPSVRSSVSLRHCRQSCRLCPLNIRFHTKKTCSTPFQCEAHSASCSAVRNPSGLLVAFRTSHAQFRTR